MKRMIAFALSALLAFSLFVGCGQSGSSSAAQSVKLEGTLEEILAKVYDGVTDMPKTMEQELTEENSEYNVGVARSEYTEGLASDAAVNAIAFSVCLMRAENEEKAQALAEAVEEKADPCKWICVEAEAKVVDRIGDVVILIMADQAMADQLSANFKALAG